MVVLLGIVEKKENAGAFGTWGSQLMATQTKSSDQDIVLDESP